MPLQTSRRWLIQRFQRRLLRAESCIESGLHPTCGNPAGCQRGTTKRWVNIYTIHNHQPFSFLCWPLISDNLFTNRFVKFVFVILVKNVIPQSLSPPGTVPWQQQAPPSPSSMSSGSTSPGYSPSHVLDLSGSSTSFSSEQRKVAHHWQNGPVQEWSKDQVNCDCFPICCRPL